MFLIKNLEERYNKEINDFIISIFVEEFNFDKYRKGIKEFDNLNYQKSGGNMWMVVNDKDEIVGTIAIMKKNESTAELKSFYVDKKYRGNGISKLLFETAMNFCKEINLNRVFLGTYECMETAIQFYKKRGFSEIEKSHIDEGAKFFEMYL